MARLKAVDPANASGEAQKLFEGPLKGKHFNIFKLLANSPAALNAYVAFSGALGKASLSAKEQEVIQLAIGQENACDYCLAAHTAVGKGAGLNEDQILGARRGRVESDPKLDAIARFAKAIHEKRGHVSDADVEAFRGAGYDDGAIAEVVASYALATFTNYFNHIAETEVDFPAAQAI
ncbi:MAG: peroxidase [Phycisphaerae bacterium]|nr:peroxidase [Phycisphaerae bacterium]